MSSAASTSIANGGSIGNDSPATGTTWIIVAVIAVVGIIIAVFFFRKKGGK